MSKEVLEVGSKNGQPYGWNFAESKTSFDAQNSDIFPRFDSNCQQITLSVTKNGGIKFISAGDLGVTSDFLVYLTEAPQDGYQSNITLNRNSLLQSAGIIFVRTRDGEHFAKFDFDPRSYTTTGSEEEREQGTWGLLLDYVYNPDGSRQLPYYKN